MRTAFASKGFTWITGSPADNEKLSVGKNAQFFGFVALRYQSGRAANRGTLGRAMYAIASQEQRGILETATLQQKPLLEQWWKLREDVLTRLEHHLYTGEPTDSAALQDVGAEFALRNSEVATVQGRAFAQVEDTLSAEQRNALARWRVDAESAGKGGENLRISAKSFMERGDLKQLEDLYARAFSWLTGNPEDNEIIPIGQPAQFFGFVSIRHKSGHAASRGAIEKGVLAILDSEQQGALTEAANRQIPVVREFLEDRHLLLNQWAFLRYAPHLFDKEMVEKLSRDGATGDGSSHDRGRGLSEDPPLSDLQLDAAMAMRGEYLIDESQVAVLNREDRGETLSILCAGCHGAPGQHRTGIPGPSLDGMWNRPIASASGFA
ncbi:MAG: hypothetical protein AAGJ31_06035 [Verrucomicrobiota bacterium]